MLHGLSRCDQTGIQSLAALKLLADLLALLNDCLNGLALDPFGLLAWAKQLGLSEAEALLKETLVEEENTDAVLSELAEEAINPAAAA